MITLNVSSEFKFINFAFSKLKKPSYQLVRTPSKPQFQILFKSKFAILVPRFLFQAVQKFHRKFIWISDGHASLPVRCSLFARCTLTSTAKCILEPGSIRSCVQREAQLYCNDQRPSFYLFEI